MVALMVQVTLFFARMSHQALQQSPLVGGGMDAVLTPTHPSLPSVPLPQDPTRPRQPQVRQQQRLLQVRGRETRAILTLHTGRIRSSDAPALRGRVPGSPVRLALGAKLVQFVPSWQSFSFSEPLPRCGQERVFRRPPRFLKGPGAPGCL